MTNLHEPADHHAAATAHHQQAALFHRGASRHYQVGKDYAHAAHQALTAHGHALHAMEHGHAASLCYAAHEGSPLPGYIRRHSDTSTTTALASPINLNETACHYVAADHHDAAGRHHEQAGRHCDAEHFVRAGYETKLALDHARHALFHGDQSAMHHMEHYGSHASAELV